MIFIPVRAQYVYDVVKSPKIIKCANRVCYNVFGAGIKDTARKYDKMGIINIKVCKAILKILSKLY